MTASRPNHREPQPDSPDERGPPPPPSDPRLEIPEILRQPASAPERQPAPGLDRAGMTQTAEAWGVALDFVVTIVAGALLGWLFDRWRGTSPVGTLVGLGIGFVTSFIRIVRYTQRTERREREAREKDRKGGDAGGPR